MTASKRRTRALSKALNKLVVAIKTTPSCNESIPFNIEVVARPISLKSLLSSLFNAIASISSNKISVRSGYVKLFISLNKLAMFFAVCPNLLSIIVSKSTIYNSLCSSRATCFAVSVFPVPGIPSNRNLFTPILRRTAFTIPIMSEDIASGSGNGVKFAN